MNAKARFERKQAECAAAENEPDTTQQQLAAKEREMQRHANAIIENALAMEVSALKK